MSFSVRGSPVLMVGGVFLLVGVVFLGVSSLQFYGDWRFAQEGRVTQGTVVTKVISTSRDRAGGSPSRTTHYEAIYRFPIQGATIEGRDELTRAGWERLTEGGPVEVLYLPATPSSNRLAGPRPWIQKTIFGLIGLVFTGIGAVFLLRAVRQASLESSLRERGVSTKGTVKELSVGMLKINDEYYWRLKYEYQDSQGHRHVSTLDLPEDEARQWKEGDVGVVRYDPAKPAQAVWLGRS